MIRKYFLGGTTAKGYYRFYDELINNLDRVMYVEGGFTSIVHPTLEKLANEYEKQGEVGCVYNHIEPTMLEAIVIPDKRLAVIDRSKANVKRLSFPKLFENVIYIGEGFDYEYLKKNQDRLTQSRKDIQDLYQQAFENFKKAHDAHEEVEKIYIQHLNFDKANSETEKLKQSIFRATKLNKESSVDHRYLGAATPEGPMDFVLDLTSDVEKRIFIKGRSGTGKSTMLKKLVDESIDRGIDVEVYHCGFNPESLDMAIFRELGIAVFDATSPHEHEPQRSNDEIFDVYELFVEGSPDDEHAEKIIELKNNYKMLTQQATECLRQIQDRQRSFESIYQEALDDEFMKGVAARIYNWIEH
ncbi:hypothetical protein [Piscibacillus halophilus]|uniref:hypothetical protein n=1 Tax=Piscibacillus halophilus TaxID=571933 RepID=UPI00158E2C63|nr:hypothetical protein [Piscibacillus halophilus]